MSVCIFLRNGLLVFSDFLYDIRQLEYLKIDRALFAGKFIFAQIGAEKAQNGPKIGFFGFFEKF